MSRAVRRTLTLATCALVALPGLACIHAGTTPDRASRDAPRADSATVALWRFDEATGVQCADAGPFGLDGTAGPSTRASYGRFASAREFTRAIDSFVHVPYDPIFDRAGELTVEAWVYARGFGDYEDTPIAARWTHEGNQQSWLFGIVGRRRVVGGPGLHTALVTSGQSGQLVFAFQPQEVGGPRAFLSTRRLALERWTHVAASFDGSMVRFWIDGRLDAQYATRARIQASAAPVLIGNYFDVRQLTSFGGELRVDPLGGESPSYAFEGLIDELRLSNLARVDFPEAIAR